MSVWALLSQSHQLKVARLSVKNNEQTFKAFQNIQVVLSRLPIESLLISSLCIDHLQRTSVV